MENISKINDFALSQPLSRNIAPITDSIDPSSIEYFLFSDSFADTQRLLEYGFRFYATQKYFDANKEYTIAKIWGGKEDNISLGVDKDISVTLPRTNFKDIKVNYNVKNNVQAPIKKGDVLGSLEIVSKNEVVLTSDLIALNDVDAKGFFGRLWSKFILWIMSLFGMV